MIARINVVIEPTVRKLCTSAYPGHPRGCPNFGKKESCPPQVPMIDKVLDLNDAVWAFWVDFDLSIHREKMRKRHPKWSRRQLDCCLYWQGTVNKKLREAVGQRLLTNSRVVYCPEACGVNVTATMKTIGVILEWPPVNIVRKIALVGTNLCRKCSECRDVDHHWIDYYEDDGTPKKACKHCETVRELDENDN